MEERGQTSGFVLEDGTLGGAGVTGREVIHVTRIGTKVERFRYGTRSYIYKPLHFDGMRGREIWVQGKMAPLLPLIRIPRIVASASQDAPNYWLVYEDLGPLAPCSSAAERIEAAGWIPQWHRLPASLIDPDWQGHTPLANQIWREVAAELAHLPNRIRGLGRDRVAAWSLLLQSRIDLLLSEPLVVSHGDYHPLNISLRSGENIVLDWECVHLNFRYWDLYCLLDITSYSSPRFPLRPEEREAALRRYWDAAEECMPAHSGETGRRDRFSQFAADYCLYASLFSAWIAGLIERDIAAARAPVDLLQRQRLETEAVFKECLQALGVP